MNQITFTAHRQAVLTTVPDCAEPLAADEVRGRTLASLVSPGTELNGGYLGQNFPAYPGYACVFQVEEVGSEVKDIRAGMQVLCEGPHCDTQKVRAVATVPLPDGILPERAVFARLACVSMATLNTTTAHPPSRVLITGLGPIGNLAAQVFLNCGYWVTGVDPSEKRRESARNAGIADVRATIQEGPVPLVDQVQLHLECSGNERAAIEGCRVVRKRGEVVLVGVPWQRRTDIYSFELVHAIFHRYLVVRSGWEWEVPRNQVDFSGNSVVANYRAALEWLAAGKLKVDGLAEAYSPADAQKVYSGLADQTLPTPSAVFDWRLR